MKLSDFPNRFIALIHDSDKTKPVIEKQTLGATDIPAGYGAFFTVNGFDKERKKNKLTHVSGVFADIDQKDGKVSLQDIQQMMFIDLPPTIINETKNGYHCIWKLEQPIVVTDDNRKEIIETVEGIHRRFVEIYKADNAAVDVGHLLRIPNTEHRKNPTEPFLIKTVYEADDVYTLDELTKVYEPVIKEELVVEYGEVSDDVQLRLNKMLEKPHILKLWNGEVEEDKRSETDQALCNHLAFWLAKDPNAIEQAWLQSPKGQRDKVQKRADYRKITIDKAIGVTTDTYAPKGEMVVDVTKQDRPLWERKALRKKLAEENWDDKDWVKQINQLKTNYALAFHHFLAQQHRHLLYERGDDKSYWNYNEEEGVYKELSFVSARGLVLALLEKEDLLGKATESFTRDVLARYRATYLDRGKNYDDFDMDDSWFHANNGWVHLTTLEFTPHTPARLSRIKSAVDYRIDAECPNYDKFLNDDLRLSADKVRVIRQFSGLTLTNDIKYQKMLTLVGKPGCGKSTLVEAWGLVLGEKAIEKKLTELSGDSMRFAGSQFVGSTLCWFDEVDVKKAEMGNSLGTLITGQHINVERKGINGIVKARNTVKCVLTANSLPMTAELGIYRRLIMINLPRSFTANEEADKEMPHKLANEASGILNRMIEGLQDLRKMRGFTLIEGHEELIEQYKAQSNTLAEFLDTFFEPASEDHFIETTELYNSYQHFAEGNTFVRTITPQKFGRLLAAQPLNRFDCIAPKRTKTSRGWTGLKLQSGYKFQDETNKIIPAFANETAF
jgi:P4 family phage/plasmid primase-like protien